MTHTPGPWKVNRSESLFVLDKDNNLIARTYYWSGSENAGIPEANARLIAAAPEMLEVCKLLAALEADDGGRRFPTKEEIQAARNVVVKASQ